MVNRHIMIAGMLIMGVGIVSVWTGKAKGTTVTRVVLGGYVFILVLSLLDMISGLQGVIAALANVALLTVLFASGLLEGLAGIFASKTSMGGGGHQTSH